MNTLDRSGAIAFADPRFAILMVFLVIACAMVAYSTWVWRMALAEDDATRRPATPVAPRGRRAPPDPHAGSGAGSVAGAASGAAPS